MKILNARKLLVTASFLDMLDKKYYERWGDDSIQRDFRELASSIFTLRQEIEKIKPVLEKVKGGMCLNQKECQSRDSFLGFISEIEFELIDKPIDSITQ